MYSVQSTSMFSMDNSVALAQGMLEKKKRPARKHVKKTAKTRSKSSNTNNRSSKSKPVSSNTRMVRIAEHSDAHNSSGDWDHTETSCTSPDCSESTASAEVSSNLEEDDTISVVTEGSSMSQESKAQSSAGTRQHCAPLSPSKTKKQSASKNAGRLVFQHSLVVDRTWETIKKDVPHFEETLGEQVVLALMERDPKARTSMGITSFKKSSKRFDELCQFLVVLIDLWVTVCGPELEEFQDELVELGQQCNAQGIPLLFLGQAVGQAIQSLLRELQPNNERNKSIALPPVLHALWPFIVKRRTPSSSHVARKEVGVHAVRIQTQRMPGCSELGPAIVANNSRLLEGL